jgi:hypothetical protein
LAACQRLMQRFALWLCDPATTLAHLTQQGLKPPVLASGIEADWLWDFLQRKHAEKPLLSLAQTLIAMPTAEKVALTAWVQIVSALPSQFQAVPTAVFPVQRPLTNDMNWKAFQTLMEAFYEKAFRSGLPYLADGTPTTSGGVHYAEYVSTFREKHRLNPDTNAREVCVLCSGPLGDTPHVDHWIIKSAFPLLSMCADNLALICSTCNEAPNKGDKPVHSAGSFANWFHPYLHPCNGVLQLEYVLPEFTVQCSAPTAADQLKVANLDGLLNLSRRLTREFKSEYAKHQSLLMRRERRRIQNGKKRHSQSDIEKYVQQWQEDLIPSEPYHEVHQTLAAALLEPARLAAWHSELVLLP